MTCDFCGHNHGGFLFCRECTCLGDGRFRSGPRMCGTCPDPLPHPDQERYERWLGEIAP